MVRLWRPLVLISFLLALSAQPSLARTHSVASHHTTYRHYRHYQTANDDTWRQNSSQQQNFASNPAWNNPAEQSFGDHSQLQGMAEQQASANGIPVSLIDRVIKRESGGNPGAVSRGNYGLMQIRLGTARAMGYSGSASGLLDASTNMTYAVRYLAGAYRAAGGNENRAVALYASGYYTQAKARGFSPYAAAAR
jgi:soluble lytic murein transglycosylase-like protein